MSDDGSRKDGDSEAQPTGPEDVVLTCGPTEHGVAVVRVRREPDQEAEIELGEMRPLVEGQSIVGEVVTLTPRTEHPRLFDAKVVAKAPSPRSLGPSDGGRPSEPVPSRLAHKGPPRVASNAYRDNWDGIFSMRAPKGAPN